MLLVVSSENGSKKTHILYGANLSYKLVTQYLDEVVKAGLLEFDSKSLYTITSRGKEFLRLYEVYEKNHKQLEMHLNQLKNGREILREMLGS